MSRQNMSLLSKLLQASQSVPLHKFEFPARSALLLGREREGVPVQLLILWLIFEMIMQAS
jgi:tRNA G18 (ribose-2'-O)-methylase SpoU